LPKWPILGQFGRKNNMPNFTKTQISQEVQKIMKQILDMF